MSEKKGNVKDFSYYKRLLDRKGKVMSAEELLKLKHEILKSELSDTEKRGLYYGRIGPLLTEVIDMKERGIKEAEIIIKGFLVDDVIDEALATLLRKYLTIYAPDRRYASGNVFSRIVVPGITDFIKFIYVLKGKKRLGIKCLDIDNLDTTDITLYLRERSKKESEREKHRKILMSFRKWLDKDYPKEIHVFPYLEPRKEERPLEEDIEARKGRLLTQEEINSTLSAIKAIKYPANLYYEIYFRLLLVTGLRPSHALVLTVGDVTTGVRESVKDCMDREFVKIPFFRLIKKAKERIHEWIKGKRPPDYLYLPLSLRELIEDYIEKRKLTAKDRIVPVRLSGIERTIKTLRDKIGVPDLTSYCFRNTWASIIYTASGWDGDLVRTLGGWREKETVLNHYKEHFKTPDAALKAVEMLEKYEIYIPAEYKSRVIGIKEGLKAKTDVEEEKALAKAYKLIEEQGEMIEKISRRMEEYEKERR